MFQGTVRSNLDPFGEAPDNELWHALKLVHLRDAIAGGARALVSKHCWAHPALFCRRCASSLLLCCIICVVPGSLFVD